MDIVVIQQGQSLLSKMVLAGGPACRLSRRLNGREQQSHQDTNDRDDDQQLHERKTTTMLPIGLVHETPATEQTVRKE